MRVARPDWTIKLFERSDRSRARHSRTRAYRSTWRTRPSRGVSHGSRVHSRLRIRSFSDSRNRRA